MKLRLPAMEDVGFQMAPMIDCVFQLMIFFMCASHLHMTFDAPQVKLPIAANATVPQEPSPRRMITVKADGTILLGGSPVTIEKLKSEMAALQKDSPGISVFLRGDATARHKAIREVMQACAEAGMNEVIFGTLQTEQK